MLLVFYPFYVKDYTIPNLVLIHSESAIIGRRLLLQEKESIIAGNSITMSSTVLRKALQLKDLYESMK